MVHETGKIEIVLLVTAFFIGFSVGESGKLIDFVGLRKWKMVNSCCVCIVNLVAYLQLR